MNASPKSAYVNANGVRLHYLDWGGTGPDLLFLAGIRTSAYIFGGLAPRFTDGFHVIALDRRGHGDSDYPTSGYDPDTLAEDLHQVLDAFNIDRVILAGHSGAYLELSRFAALHPHRVRQLIFLESAYDYSTPDYSRIWDQNPARLLLPRWPEHPPATIQDYTAAVKRVSPSLAAIWSPVLEQDILHSVHITPAGVVDKMTEEIYAALSAACNAYRPEYENLRLPLLAVFALRDGLDYLSPQVMSPEQRREVLQYFQHTYTPYLETYIRNFQRRVPHARLVVLPHSHHFCFLKDEQRVYEAMRTFLAES